jgi:hypothetical protein
VWVALATGGGAFGPVTQWASIPAGSTPDQVQFADFNGDHKMDLAYFYSGQANNQISVAISNGTGFGALTPWIQYGPGASLPSQMQYEDVNGDGKADALYFDTFRPPCGCNSGPPRPIRCSKRT